MAAKRYLALVAGKLKMIAAVVASAGAANDGDLVALGADGKLDPSVMPSGFGQNTVVVQASEALSAGDLVNIHNSAGSPRARKADATTTGKEAHGFVLSAVSSGANATIYLTGNTLSGLSGMTPGARQYLATTAGQRTETPPTGAGQVVQMLGFALSATELAFEPEEPIELS